MKGLAGDEVFNEGALTALLGQVSAIRIVAPLGMEEQADFGLDAPLAVITLQTAAETYSLRVGAKDPADNSYIFSASNSPYFTRIAEFTGANFVAKTRADFLTLPPAPAPEPAGVAPQ